MRPRLWRPRNCILPSTISRVIAGFNEAEALETSEYRPYRDKRPCNLRFNEAEALETSEYAILYSHIRYFHASMRPRLWRPRNKNNDKILFLGVCASMRPRLWRPRNMRSLARHISMASRFNEAEALETSESDIQPCCKLALVHASMRPRLWRPRNAAKSPDQQRGARSFNEAEALETSE